MNWFSWLFGKEEGPPEPLVLGAKLRCPYGSHDGYLYVDSEDIEVNNLPKACVDDCKALYNIQPLGDCYAGGSCEALMDLAEKWENPEPQGEKINGKEIITTKSLLSCRVSGMELKIINSGQDGIFAKQILLIREMDKKYPGLREILDNPYGSLYLNKGKYEMAIRFIEDRMKKNEGEIELFTLYGKNNLEGEYIKGALGRLMPYCDTGALENLVNGIETSGCKNGMDAATGWDAHVINAEMIRLLRKDCKETAERIETKPFYRWQEENKLFLSVAAEGVTNFAYGALLYYSAVAGAGNNQSRGNKPVAEEVDKGGSGTKGSGKTTAKDWVGKTSDLAKQSPIEMPDNATVKIQNKAGGYDQITYQWSDGTHTYKARWHTPTPNAPGGSGNSWVVEQVTPGTPTGQLRVEKIYTPGANGDWTPMWQWKDAVDAYNKGTMSSLQSEIMKAGHIPAP
ncbi:PAAR-like protein [Lacrimispora sp.]|uniref:PAAR-like protein n=1 Tax=Lacrimispora sp. TaxID=2719234 RepID=UPI0028A7CA87|nr:PAAR-like protein [Lacrimispora sp.]